MRKGSKSGAPAEIGRYHMYACTSSYHTKEVYIISNESDEICMSSYGDKIMVGKVYVSIGDNSLKNS